MSPLAWTLVVALAVMFAAAAALAAWIAARRSAASARPDPAAALSLLQQQFLDLKNEMQHQVGDLTRTLHDQLAQGQKTIGERLEGTTRVVSQVQNQLGALAKTAESMQEMGRSLGDLQNILKAPKLRGLLGEMLLEELLRQVLPESAYTLQHTFRTGAKVDAVIRLGGGLVPVDAKFPLEAFSRMNKAESEEARKTARREFAASVRGRVDEIADKYILPDESTYDFALMYIPAENVFYEVILRDVPGSDSDLTSYALARRVLPVSPNSFYAYLNAIAYGLKGLRIEKEAQAVFDRVRALQQGFAQFLERFALVGKQIGYAQSNFSEASRQADRLQDRLGALTGSEIQPGALAADAEIAALPEARESPDSGGR
jgi:DNA recombination protein RmuC